MRSRVTVSADKAAKILTIRYIGDIDGGEIADSQLQQMSEIDHIWEYDAIFDMRRYDSVILSPEVKELGERWRDLVSGRDAGRCSAIITSDPFIIARLPATQAQFPGRHVEIFAQFDEGLDWIKSHRITAIAV